MDLQFFTQTTALAVVAVVVVQQILKLKFVPVSFANKYPVPTNILLSIVASIIAVWQHGVTATTWQDWLVLACTVSVVSAITYNNLLRNWTELRETEGVAK